MGVRGQTWGGCCASPQPKICYIEEFHTNVFLLMLLRMAQLYHLVALYSALK